MRYGHTEKLCRGTARCSNCGAEHNKDSCRSQFLSCVLCQDNHRSNDREKFPIYEKQKKSQTKNSGREYLFQRGIHQARA